MRARVGEVVYKCGLLWDEVVYSVGVVGDSGIGHKLRVLYGDKFAWKSTVIAPPIMVGFQANSELSRTC